MNKAILTGNVGSDPEIKSLEGGNKIAKMSLATTERFKKQDGSKAEVTEWHNLVVFGKLAEVIEKYVKKGDKIEVVGKIKTRSYEKNGSKSYFTEIVVNEFGFLGSPKGSPQSNTNGVKDQGLPKGEFIEPDSDISSDDLPF